MFAIKYLLGGLLLGAALLSGCEERTPVDRGTEISARFTGNTHYYMVGKITERYEERMVLVQYLDKHCQLWLDRREWYPLGSIDCNVGIQTLQNWR